MAATVAAIFMLQLLQDFPLLFQRFPTTPGSSMQHGCNMPGVVCRLRSSDFQGAFHYLNMAVRNTERAYELGRLSHRPSNSNQTTLEITGSRLRRGRTVRHLHLGTANAHPAVPFFSTIKFDYRVGYRTEQKPAW